MPEATPYTHPCDVGDIEYSMADQGRIWCRECGKQWSLGFKGWTPHPLIKRKPVA